MVMIMLSQSTEETRTTVGLGVENSEMTIRSCLQSILNQQYAKKLVEITVVDEKNENKTRAHGLAPFQGRSFERGKRTRNFF